MFSQHFAETRCPGYSLHGQRAVLPQHTWCWHMLFNSSYQLAGSQITELPKMGDSSQVYQCNIHHNSLYQLKMQSKLITVPFAGRKGNKAEMPRAPWKITSCKRICTKSLGTSLETNSCPRIAGGDFQWNLRELGCHLLLNCDGNWEPVSLGFFWISQTW